jgi:hypothetical protein
MTERPLWDNLLELEYQISFDRPLFVDMAEDKTIKSKKDDSNHDGKASNVRREQESTHQLQEASKELPPVNSPKP